MGEGGVKYFFTEDQIAFFQNLGFYKDSKKTPWIYMGITKIPFELISGLYQDYKKRKPGFYRDYEKPRKKAMGFYKDSKKKHQKVVWGFLGIPIFFFGILRDSSGFCYFFGHICSSG